jgi:hypothetical protein
VERETSRAVVPVLSLLFTCGNFGLDKTPDCLLSIILNHMAVLVIMVLLLFPGKAPKFEATRFTPCD